ncbi:hypothetical protein VPH35_031606 [Triticum aestivum]
MMTGVQKAKNTNEQEMHMVSADAVQANVLASVAYGAIQDTTAPPVRKRVIFLKNKGRKLNVQTVVSVVTERTPATSLRWFCMLLKMLLYRKMKPVGDLLKFSFSLCVVEGSVAVMCNDNTKHTVMFVSVHLCCVHVYHNYYCFSHG